MREGCGTAGSVRRMMASMSSGGEAGSLAVEAGGAHAYSPAGMCEEGEEEGEEEEEECVDSEGLGSHGVLLWRRVKRHMRDAERAAGGVAEAERSVRKLEAEVEKARGRQRTLEEECVRLKRRAAEELLRGCPPSMIPSSSVGARERSSVRQRRVCETLGPAPPTPADDDDAEESDQGSLLFPGEANSAGGHTCPECSFSCDRPARLREHVYTKHRGGSFPCPVRECGEGRATSDHLRQHLRDGHGLSGRELAARMRDVRSVLPHLAERTS